MTDLPNSEISSAGNGRLTQKQYARRRGWSKQYVNQLVKQGRIPLIDGMIDPVAADAALAQNRDPARERRFSTNGFSKDGAAPATASVSAGPTQGTFVKARTVREHYRALRERLEYEQLAGKVLPREEVQDAAFTIGRAVRDGLDVAARRIGEVVASKFGVNEAEAIDVVESEMRKTLEEFARNLSDPVFDIRAGLSPRQADSTD